MSSRFHSRRSSSSTSTRSPTAASISSWPTGKQPARASTIPERGEPATTPQASSERLYLLAWGLYLALATVAVVWIAWRDGTVSTQLFLRVDSFRAIASDLLLGVGSALALVTAWRAAHRVSRGVRALEEQLAQHVGELPRDRLMAIALLSGFGEELFFRGALQGSIGLWWASLVFGFCHLGPVRESRLWAVYAVAAGLGFGALVQWRGTLLPAIVAHCLVNAAGLDRLSKAVAQSSHRSPASS